MYLQVCTFFIHTYTIPQEADGWCEENTYEKLRKTITAAMKTLAASIKGNERERERELAY